MLLGWTWHESAPHFDWFAVDGNADGKGRNVVSLQQPCAKRALRLAHAHWVARPQARLRLARSAEVPWQAPALHRVAYMSEITELLRAVQAGDHASLDAVFERVYAELRTLAAARLASQPGESTLSATALVHESYLKLSDASQLSLTDRKHFFACAAGDAPDPGRSCACARCRQTRRRHGAPDPVARRRHRRRHARSARPRCGAQPVGRDRRRLA